MGEGGFAVAEVVVPLADEAVVELELVQLLVVGVEARAPLAQRADVVQAEVVQLEHMQVAHALEGLGDAAHGHEERTGEDVLLNPVHAGDELAVTAVGAGDVLQGEQAVVLEQAVALAEVTVHIALADGFEHLDGNDFVEAARDIAVVLDADLRVVADALADEAFAAVVVLGLREGEGGDLAAVFLHRVTGEAAPARADFKDVVSGLEAERAAERLILCGLRILDGLLGRGPDAARIGHGFVEPEFVKVVPEVVVVGDVLAAALAGIASERVLEAIAESQEVQRGGLGVRTRHAGRLLDVLDEPAEHGGEIVRVPIAVHVSLTEADVAVEHAALEELRAVDAEVGGDLWRVAEAAGRAAGQGDVEAAQGHARKRLLDGALVETRAQDLDRGVGFGTGDVAHLGGGMVTARRKGARRGKSDVRQPERDGVIKAVAFMPCARPGSATTRAG